MIILEDWQSGAEYKALKDAKMTSPAVVNNESNLYEFDNNGLLLDQGKVESIPISYLSSVTALVDHGFVYLASREFFLYSQKHVLLAEPNDVLDMSELPEHIRVAFGYISGIPSNVPVSVFYISGIPTWDTPMIVSRLIDKRWSRPLVITANNTLNTIDRGKLNFFPGKNTGIEEPMAEVYNNEKLRSIHKDEDVIVKPDKHLYDPLTSSLYVKEDMDVALVEYETSPTREVTLGNNFSASNIGKEFGLLSLIQDSKGSGEFSNIGLGRRVISLAGSSIYVSIPEGVVAYVIPQTVYIKEDGSEFQYESLYNNNGYVVINPLEDYTGKLYTTTGQLVGKVEDVTILPIVAYLNDEIHTTTQIDKTTKFTVVPSEKGLISSDFRITVATDVAIIAEERMFVNKTLSKTSVGGPSEKSAYIKAGESSIVVDDIIDVGSSRARLLRDVYKLENQDIDILMWDLGDVGVEISIDPQSEDAVLIYKTYTHRIVGKLGGDLYGI